MHRPHETQEVVVKNTATSTSKPSVQALSKRAKEKNVFMCDIEKERERELVNR